MSPLVPPDPTCELQTVNIEPGLKNARADTSSGSLSVGIDT